MEVGTEVVRSEIRCKYCRTGLAQTWHIGRLSNDTNLSSFGFGTAIVSTLELLMATENLSQKWILQFQYKENVVHESLKCQCGISSNRPNGGVRAVSHTSQGKPGFNTWNKCDPIRRKCCTLALVSIIRKREFHQLQKSIPVTLYIAIQSKTGHLLTGRCLCVWHHACYSGVQQDISFDSWTILRSSLTIMSSIFCTLQSFLIEKL